MGWLNDLVHHVAPPSTPPRWSPGTSTCPAAGSPGLRLGFIHHRFWSAATTAQPLASRMAWILLGAGRSGYDAMTMTLQAGDVLLLYSDGLVERRDRPLDEGLGRQAGPGRRGDR